jgi:hypothetical protein
VSTIGLGAIVENPNSPDSIIQYETCLCKHRFPPTPVDYRIHFASGWAIRALADRFSLVSSEVLLRLTPEGGGHMIKAKIRKTPCKGPY